MHPNHCTSLIIVLPCLALLVVVASHSVVLAPQLISYDCIRVDTVLLLFHKWSTLVTCLHMIQEVMQRLIAQLLIVQVVHVRGIDWCDSWLLFFQFGTVGVGIPAWHIHLLLSLLLASLFVLPSSSYLKPSRSKRGYCEPVQ